MTHIIAAVAARRAGLVGAQKASAPAEQTIAPSVTQEVAPPEAKPAPSVARGLFGSRRGDAVTRWGGMRVRNASRTSTSTRMAAHARSADAFTMEDTMLVLSRTMPMIPRRTSPLADTLDDDTDMVFPGERLSRIEDFVRLRVAAQSVSFLSLLTQEGIAPSYYAAMVARFDEVRRVNQRVNETFLRKFAEAVRR